MRYVIVTGYCSTPETTEVKESQLIAWMANTLMYTAVNKPEAVFVVSPEQVPIPGFPCQWISCLNNLGHVGHLISGQKGNKLCGWTVSTLIGALLAYHADADMIFKEQDCFAYGAWVEGIYRQAAEEGRSMLFGRSSFMEVEQSLFFIRKDRLLDYVYSLLAMPQSDAEWLPEYKFKMLMTGKPAETGFLTFGYGRDRPIGYDDPVFYAQQLKDEEIQEIKSRGLM